MKTVLEPGDAAQVKAIADNSLSELSSLAEAGPYSEQGLRFAIISYLSLKMLEGGECRTTLLQRLEASLQGKCPCELETQGSA